MSTTYRGSLGSLALVSLIVVSLACALPAQAQAGDVIVAIEPADSTMGLQGETSVAVSIANVSDLFSYQFTVAFEPAVVQVLEVEQGPFLGSTGQSSVKLGPEIDNEAGRVVFGLLGMGSGSWPSGSGELATLTLKAVAEGATDLDLQDVQVFNDDGDAQAVVLQDGRVEVGDGASPTRTPTTEGVPTASPVPTSGATATQAATSPAQATATKTPTGVATTPPEATAAETATESPTSVATTPPETTATSPSGATATSPSEAAATGSPTEAGAPAGGATSTAQPGQTLDVEGSPSATGKPVEGEDIEPTATSDDEASGGGTPPGVAPWLIPVAAVLGLAGIALIGVGVSVFGLGRRDDEEPMDDDNA